MNESNTANFAYDDSAAAIYDKPHNQELEDELRHEKHALEILRECCSTIYSSESRELPKSNLTMLNHRENAITREVPADRSSSFSEIVRYELPNSILSANCTMLFNEGSVSRDTTHDLEFNPFSFVIQGCRNIGAGFSRPNFSTQDD